MVKWLNFFFQYLSLINYWILRNDNIVITNALTWREGFVIIEFEELSIYVCFVS